MVLLLINNKSYNLDNKVIAVDKPEVFKDSLKKNFFELKLLYNNKSNKNKLKNKIESIIDKQDNYYLKEDYFILELNIKQGVFNKAAEFEKDFKLLEINKIEADLQQVFNKLNS